LIRKKVTEKRVETNEIKGGIFKQKKAPQQAVLYKSLLTDRVNLQEIKMGYPCCQGLESQTKHNNTTTQQHTTISQKLSEHAFQIAFRSGSRSAVTIGIYWYILNGQFIMAQIKKTNR